MKILVIPDKFKGTLTAPAAARAIARGWRQARPGDAIQLLPTTDGGDGFGEVIGQLLGAKIRITRTVDAAHRPCEAQWWWEPKTKTAILESANVIGIAKLPPGKFHPFELDTFGLGAVIHAAAEQGARRCLIGIGGSATNDGGFGLARALGWKFWDREEKPIGRWTELHQLARISPPKRRRWFSELIVAMDVQNPLLGPRGATRIYGPQKGLQKRDFALAEQCLRALAACGVGLRSQRSNRHSQSLATIPGSGAAGGLGFGLMTFLSAHAQPGFELFARLAKLDRHLRSADMVITGEGCLDASSFMGKATGEIARRCHREKIPCLAIAGQITSSRATSRLFTQAHSLAELTTIKNAQAHPAAWLEKLGKQIAHGIGVCRESHG